MGEIRAKPHWQNPLLRAAMIHGALLGSGWIVALAIARALGLSVSVLGLLLAYAVVNIVLTGWLLRRRSEDETEPERDAVAEALAEFAEEPLGITIAEAKGRLAKARKAVGRQAAMYQPLDRLVRLTRKIERRLALEPSLRDEFSRFLADDLPMIASTAEQYVALSDEDLSPAEADRLILAEGVLREAGDQLDRLARGEGKIDAPVIGLIRMDTNAEVLAERFSADLDAASRRAAAARISHALRKAGRRGDGPFHTTLTEAAEQVETMAKGADGVLPRNSAALIVTAESYLTDPCEASLMALRNEVALLV